MRLSRLLFKSFKGRPLYTLLSIITASLPIAMSIFILSLAFNTTEYKEIVEKDNNYIRQITFYDSSSLDYEEYEHRLLETLEIDNIIYESLNLPVDVIALSNKEEFLFESDRISGFEILGDDKLQGNSLIISDSLARSLDKDFDHLLGKKLEISQNEEIKEYIITGILDPEISYIFSLYNYPEVFIYREEINPNIFSIETRDISEVEGIIKKLAFNINFQYEIKSMLTTLFFINASLVVFTVLILLIGLYTFKIIYETIFNDKIRFIAMLGALGFQKQDYYFTILIQTIIYTLITILLGTLFAYLVSYLIGKYIDWEILLGDNFIISKINVYAIIATFLLLLIGAFLLGIKSLSRLLKKDLNLVINGR
ncbi:MAG: FtsX-like permease family protein [Bacilli bacterium]|nr:FtsX-like permease family protein [Bacilli bacterium]